MPTHSSSAKSLLALAIVCMQAFTAVLPAHAADASLGPTLEKIQAARAIAVGHRTSSIPFSYYDDSESVVGFSQDLCMKVIDAVRARLGAPKLAVRMVPVTAQNRIPLLQNGTIDIECGVTSHLKDRALQAAFLTSIYASTPKIPTRRNSGIQDFPDLAGKTIVTIAGGSPERLLRNLNETRRMNMQIQSVKDYAEGLLILQSGRAAAYVMDDILMAGARLQTQNPDDWTLVGSPVGEVEPWGFMVRRDDPVFKKLGDDALRATMASGEIEQIYARWFTKPIPPRQANFNLPLSDVVRKLYTEPNDRPAN